MIKLSSKFNFKVHGPKRRRISNQLAAIAAVMLFASTQVGVPQNVEHSMSAESELQANVITANDGSVVGGSWDESTERNEDTPNPSSPGTLSTSGNSRKAKGLKLNLFRFRR